MEKKTVTPKPIEGMTHGTGSAIKGLVDNYNKIQCGVVCINLLTIIRNFVSEYSVSASVAAEHTIKEAGQIGRELIEVMLTANHVGQPIIVFYLYDYYRTMDKDGLRPCTGQRAMIEEVARELLDKRTKYFKSLVATVKGVKLLIDLSVDNTEPDIKLRLAIQNNTPNRRVCMLTHTPIDMHVRATMDNFIVVNSHTGSFVLPKDLPTKVYGEKYKSVPFYKSTHFLFGDSGLIKPSLAPKDKKIIAEKAEAELWKTQPESFIIGKLKSMGYI